MRVFWSIFTSLTKPDSCVIVVCMLVRKQILLEKKQALELEELALLAGVSMSEVYRRIFDEGVKIQKKRVAKGGNKKLGGAEFMLQQARKAVAGPGDSEYDKYAYDL